MKKIIVIVGPTASGKTSVGVQLAKKFNGEIVSADSRQVYRGLDLGTGKEGIPCGAREIHNLKFKISNQFLNDKLIIEQLNENCKLKIENLRRSIRRIDGVDQWMIDIVEPGKRFTLFDYLPLARMVIEDILSRDKTPIVVGGTGLYVQGLVEGFQIKESRIMNHESCKLKYSIIQDANEVILNECEESSSNAALDPSVSALPGGRQAQDDKLSREYLDNLTIEQLGDILRGISPEMFDQVDLNNPHRVIRAIERAQSGEEPAKIKPDWDVLQIGIKLPREELHNRIDKRVDDRFEQGMLSEAENLLKSGVNPDWLLKLGLEYKMMTSFLISNSKFLISNQISKPKSEFQRIHSMEEMKQTLKFKSHQYARRQLTWFRRFPEIKWLNKTADIEKEVEQFLEGMISIK